MLGRNVRNVVGCFQCFGSGDYLHSACSGACTGNSDGDGAVRGGWYQDGGGKHHGYRGPTSYARG